MGLNAIPADNCRAGGRHRPSRLTNGATDDANPSAVGAIPNDGDANPNAAGANPSGLLRV
jgi:hypothetical protein